MGCQLRHVDFFGQKQTDERLVTFTRSIDTSGTHNVILFVGIPEEDFFQNGQDAGSLSMIIEEPSGQPGNRIIWNNQGIWEFSGLRDVCVVSDSGQLDLKHDVPYPLCCR